MSRMDDDYARDREAQHEIDGLRRSIDDFLAPGQMGPWRCSAHLLRVLEDARAGLREASDHIVRVWD